MEKLLIVGAGGLGRMTLEAACDKFECYFVDDKYNAGEIICDALVVGKICDIEKLSFEYHYLVCAIGNNSLRERIISDALKIGYKLPNIVFNSAYVSKYSQIGYGNIFLNNVCIQNGAKVGNGVVVTANSEIHHDCEIGDFSLIYSCSVVRTYAKVGKRVKIGSNVSISNSAIIGDDLIIENGAVIK